MRKLIGVVTGTKLDKYEDQIAWIRPLVEVTGPLWQVISDPESEFPTRGSIFCPRAAGAKENALIRLHAKANSVRSDGPDEYMVVDFQTVFEVVDLRAIGNCEKVRAALSSGIQLPPLFSPKFMIWCAGNVIVGPVALVFGANGLATLEKNNRARIPCFELSEQDIRQVSHEGLTRSLIARPNLGQPESYVDWDDDKQVMRRAIDLAVSKLKRRVVDLPKQMIEEAIEQLTMHGSSADVRLELYRLKRSALLAQDVQQVASVADDVFTAARNHPSVIDEINKFNESQRHDVRSAIENALSNERKELERIKKERDEVEQAVAAATRSLGDTEASLKEQMSRIEAKIHGRIEEVLSDAPSLLAEVALLRPFLTGHGSAGIALDLPLWRQGSNRISDAKEMKARIIPAFRAMGVLPAVYQPIHAAMAAGLMPMVGGARALESLEAYAHVVTGGRSLVIQVTSAVADVQDLFGRVTERRFVPHAAGLIDVVRAARNSHGLFLVVLDGVNRGATESFLLPLIDATRRRVRSISLFHRCAIELYDPYLSEARFEWPHNLLLAATLIEGPTTLPIAPDVWSESVLIQSDLEADSAIPGDFSSDPSEIDPSSKLLSVEPSFENSDWIKEGISSLQPVASRFEGGFRTVTSDNVSIQENIAKCVIVPYLASITDDEERAAKTKAAEKSLGKSLKDWIAVARRCVS